MRTVVTSIEGEPTYIPVYSGRYLAFAFVAGLLAGFVAFIGIALWSLR